jgi:hypothetical protein
MSNDNTVPLAPHIASLTLAQGEIKAREILDHAKRLRQIKKDYPELADELNLVIEFLRHQYNLNAQATKRDIVSTLKQSKKNKQNASLIDVTRQDILDEWAALKNLGKANKTNLAKKLWNMSRVTLDKKLEEFGLTYDKNLGIVDK